MPFSYLRVRKAPSAIRMERIEVRFPDGTTLSYPKGTLLKDILADPAMRGKAADVVTARVDGVLLDLRAPLNKGGLLEWADISSRDGLEVLRHSTSHVMAQAVQSLFPGAKITIGPAIREGFYYDFDFDQSFSPEDFPRIEGKMKEIIDRDLPLVRKTVFREEALRLFQERGEPYKRELIEDLPDS